MGFNRRQFVSASAILSVLGVKWGWSESPHWKPTFSRGTSHSDTELASAFIATWPFGKIACETAIETIAAGNSGLDAIEAGIQLVEADEGNASVGIGGIPNAAGLVQLDACIMSGPGHRAGSVAAIHDTLHPISVARRVMETTPHVLLVGSDARDFATAEGFPITNLLTEHQREQWEQWKTNQKKLPINQDHHDTIAMVGMDRQGDMFGGCSTSGWGYKLAGRVGDSPIIGAGLYVDNQIGAAGATGLGENVMRFCGSFLVVEMMRQGASPEQACRLAIERIAETAEMEIKDIDVNFIAINKAGEYGAAGTSNGFQYSHARLMKSGEKSSGVTSAAAMSNKKIGPEGGNIK